MPYPRSPAAIEAQLAAIAAAHPAICARTILKNPTHEGRKVSMVKIGKGAGPRRVVVITGGHHGREWAPPDALLSLIDKLLKAYDGSTSLTIPAFTDFNAAPPIRYPATQIPLPDIRRIVERLDVYIVPLVNPDGRNHTMVPKNAVPKGDINWRKNRRPNLPSACIGVDLNRNYPFPGDYQVYYSVAAESYVSASRNPCDFDNYIGDPLGEEPEVKNVIELITSMTVDYFVDVHSAARKILFAWGTDGSQSDQATKDDMNWRKTRWHRGGDMKGRDGTSAGPYNEFFPNDPPHRLQDVHGLVGGQMRDAILRAAGGDQRARARSRYEVQPAIDMYPAPGVASDFAFSRNLDPGTLRPLIAFTIECSLAKDLEGGRQPPVFIFPKIEREVHLALLALLSRAAAQPKP